MPAATADPGPTGASRRCHPGTARADLLLRGGRIHRVEPATDRAEAVGLRAGRIVAVGREADVRPLVGPRTEVVDLRGRALLPGFQDAHVHPPAAGLELLRCNLADAASPEECRRAIRAYAEAHPEVPWVVGGGWSMDLFPGGAPGREELDALVPDRPAYLDSRDGHSAWVNSRALELAGITRTTPDPPDGRLERDEHGEPRGTLHEGAMGLVARHLPPTTEAEWLEGLLLAQRHLHSLGITAWQDAIVGGPTTASTPTSPPPGPAS